MTFDEHLNMRKLMAPAFTPQALARTVPRLVELAQEHCERWSQQEEVQGVQAIKAFTFHVSTCDHGLLVRAGQGLCTGQGRFMNRAG